MATYDAETFEIEWDETGCVLLIEDTEIGTFSVQVNDPEKFYDRVKAAILPWLMERDDAERAFNRAYSAEEDARQGFALARDAEADARDAFSLFTEEDR